MPGPMDSLRNLNLNSAYKPNFPDPQSPYNPDLGDFMPQGDTRFDPFQGTNWGNWLDAAGAKKPGGMKIGPQMGAGGFSTDTVGVGPRYSPLGINGPAEPGIQPQANSDIRPGSPLQALQMYRVQAKPNLNGVS